MNCSLEPLTGIKAGMSAMVKEVRGGKNVRNRLMEMGIIEGTTIRVIANSGVPLIVQVGNSRFAMGHGMAQKIIVDRVYKGIDIALGREAGCNENESHYHGYSR